MQPIPKVRRARRYNHRIERLYAAHVALAKAKASGCIVPRKELREVDDAARAMVDHDWFVWEGAGLATIADAAGRKDHEEVSRGG